MDVSDEDRPYKMTIFKRKILHAIDIIHIKVIDIKFLYLHRESLFKKS